MKQSGRSHRRSDAGRSLARNEIASVAVLERLDSFAALEEWREVIVASIESMHCVGGCPLGFLGSLAESDQIARTALANSFARWQGLLQSGLTTMRDRGELDLSIAYRRTRQPRANPGQLIPDEKMQTS
jgi:hypothetical protein